MTATTRDEAQLLNRTVLASTIGALLAGGSAAHAQAPAPAQDPGLEEITVTGSRIVRHHPPVDVKSPQGRVLFRDLPPAQKKPRELYRSGNKHPRTGINSTETRRSKSLPRHGLFSQKGKS